MKRVMRIVLSTDWSPENTNLHLVRAETDAISKSKTKAERGIGRSREKPRDSSVLIMDSKEKEQTIRRGESWFLLRKCHLMESRETRDGTPKIEKQLKVGNEGASMSMQHSCSWSTCNDCRKQFCSMSSRGDGGWTRKEASPICHCGEMSVLRTAKTTKNRGKQFWSCPRYKGGGENAGCNFFRWWSDFGTQESASCELLETNDVRVMKTFKNDDRLMKTIGNERDNNAVTVQKAVTTLEKWIKILVGVVFILCVINMIAVAMLMGRA
ncbi:hypothetical protein V8G54_003677 [Vigna mungo]|uniref:GRF-type domain-containing protein n=1 Tax=Vigna mungo TaxID=3915 RepID=A0AAQ3PED7_VIGMU